MIASMLVSWGLSRRLAGVMAYVLPALAIVLLCWLLWLLIDSREAADDQHNQTIGRTIEREEAQAAVIEQIGAANEAREEARQVIDRGPSPELHALCLRSARTPASCDRYLLPE